jgi:integrase
MAEMIIKIESGCYIRPNKYTVGSWLDYWIKEVCKIAYATQKSYKQTIEYHLKPEIGNIPLQKLSAVNLQKYYNGKLKTLSSTSVLYHHRVLNSALECARKMHMIENNPCQDLTPPQKAEFEAELPNYDVIAQVIDEVYGTVMYIPVVIALTTGMRRGEVCGLTWDNVLCDHGYIHVCQALKHAEGGGLELGPTKTKRIRDVPLTTECKKALEQLKEEQEGWRKFFGEDYEKNNLVCCWQNGRMIDPDFITKKWKKIKKTLKINSKTRFHDLRHNYASTLLSLNADMKIVSASLGHADIRTTYNFYAHVPIEVKQKQFKI